MGFKLNYNLAATGDAVPGGTSAAGNNSLALPYNRQAGIDTAQDLIDDVTASGGGVFDVSQFVESTDSFNTYSGAKSQTNFNLVAGEAVFIRMSTGVDYIVVGSHDPGLTVPLEATGAGSAAGNNFFSVPYHTTAADAQDLINSIGAGSVFDVSQFLEATDSFDTFSGAKSQTPFTLVPGEGVFVRMSSTVNHVPSHF
ncbi:hypothetical protein ABI59_03780 [Acidobacteria bacterium Mor1]|nr:hypothetical protein ABI59_03780 [Acidobacteria bacterium Mor1]